MGVLALAVIAVFAAMLYKLGDWFVNEAPSQLEQIAARRRAKRKLGAEVSEKEAAIAVSAWEEIVAYTKCTFKEFLPEREIDQLILALESPTCGRRSSRHGCWRGIAIPTATPPTDALSTSVLCAISKAGRHGGLFGIERRHLFADPRASSIACTDAHHGQCHCAWLDSRARGRGATARRPRVSPVGPHRNARRHCPYLSIPLRAGEQFYQRPDFDHRWRCNNKNNLSGIIYPAPQTPLKCQTS